MILFIIICVVVLSSLTYWRPRPNYGWGWFRPFYRRHHRPMGMGPGMGPMGHGPRPMGGGPRPMGGFGGPRGGGFGGHGPGMGGHGPGGHGGPRH